MALDRYLRARRRHDQADSAALWLGKRGPMTPSGIGQMLDRRAHQAGIGHVHPHQFRAPLRRLAEHPRACLLVGNQAMPKYRSNHHHVGR